MAISNPIAVYIATGDHEAQLVRIRLENSGIESHITNDDPFLGIGNPRVWVDQTDVKTACRELQKYVDELEDRRRREEANQVSANPIEVVCEDCGQRLFFSAQLQGTIQVCSKCDAYVDVRQPK